jgi:hypothetical protein
LKKFKKSPVNGTIFKIRAYLFIVTCFSGRYNVTITRFSTAIQLCSTDSYTSEPNRQEQTADSRQPSNNYFHDSHVVTQSLIHKSRQRYHTRFIYLFIRGLFNGSVRELLRMFKTDITHARSGLPTDITNVFS